MYVHTVRITVSDDVQMIKSECEPTAVNPSTQLICGHVPIPIRQKIYFLFMFFRKRSHI